MSLRSTIGIALLTPATLMAAAGHEPAACPSVPVARATLELHDQTGGPIYVYIDGVFAARCDMLEKQRVTVERAGEIEIVGRFRCDTWGPRRVKLESGKTTVCAFTEVGRAAPKRGEPAVADGERHRIPRAAEAVATRRDNDDDDTRVAARP